MPDNPDLLFAFNLSPEKAVEYFRSKGYELTWDWFEVWQESHAKAFTVAKCLRMDVLKDIRDLVDKSLAGGMGFSDFKKDMRSLLARKGWGPEGVDLDLMGIASDWRIKTIYETNLQTALNAGRWREMMENVDHRPYWQYIAVLDSRTRPAHAALHGKIFRYDDPFWATHYPPLGFRCRCRVRALTAAEVKAKGLTVETSEGKMTLRDELVSKKTGELQPVSVYTDPFTGEKIATDVGWSYNPGAAYSIDQVAYEKALLLPEEARAFFINEMARAQIYQEMFPSWVDMVVDLGQSKGLSTTVGWMDNELMTALKGKGLEPESAVITINDQKILHMVRDAKLKAGIDLSIDEIKNIPSIISDPKTAVFIDRQYPDVILYAFDSADKAGKLVIEINYRLKTEKVNLIKSGGRVFVENLMKDERYELIKGEI